jgi:Protein of unknown function (DUF1416)
MNSDPKVLFRLLAKIVTGAAFTYVCASWRDETVIAQANLSAQVVVTGTVTNSDGALISAAAVQAISETGEIAAQTTSLEDGSFPLDPQFGCLYGESAA